VRVDGRQDVAGPGENPIDLFPTPRGVAESPQEAGFAAAIRVEAGVGMTAHELEDLLEDARLFTRAVRPEGVPLFDTISHHDQAQQVVEATFGIALDVEIDARGRVG
jgi:hypothetical protein